MTNEDLFAAKRFFKDTLGLENFDFEVEGQKKGYRDDFLMKADKNPNTEGAKKLGLSAMDNSGLEVAQILAHAKDKRLKALYICHHDLEKGFKKEEVKAALSKVDLVIFQGTNENTTSNLANYCLPSATFVEKDGTFTNFSGRVQKIHKAVEPLGDSKPDWIIFRHLSKRLGKSMPYFEAEDVFKALAEEIDAFKGMSYEKLGEHGASCKLISFRPMISTSPNGMTAKPTSAKNTEMAGAMVKRNFSAATGRKLSLVNILTASAIAWKRPIRRNPKMEARFAPIRSCISALCLRSTQVRRPPKFNTKSKTNANFAKTIPIPSTIRLPVLPFLFQHFFHGRLKVFRAQRFSRSLVL